jgi:Rod binding domain-containing protein
MSGIPLNAPILETSLAPLTPKLGTVPSKSHAMKVAKDFESVFLAQFASVMVSSVKSDGPFGGGPTEDIYKSLLSQEYGKAIAGSGRFGIADSVYREIIKSQEVQ